MCCFIYPVVAHWVWHEDGWLNENDFIDFAGSGAVHLLGGASGFIGTLLLGPRYDIFGIWENPFAIKVDGEADPKAKEMFEDDGKLTALVTQIFDSLQLDDPNTAKLPRSMLPQAMAELIKATSTDPPEDFYVDFAWN